MYQFLLPKLLNLELIVYRAYVRLGEWNVTSMVDCENNVCAPAPIEITIADVFSKGILDLLWSNPIVVLKLSRTVTLSGKTNIYTFWYRNILIL